MTSFSHNRLIIACLAIALALALLLVSTNSQAYQRKNDSRAAVDRAAPDLETETSRADAEGDLDLKAFLQEAMTQEQGFKDRFDAEVWLLSMSGRLQRYIKDAEQRESLLKSIYLAARRANLEPDIVLAVIQVESAFDRYAVSRVGAQGLMQVMPFWKKEIGRPDDNLTQVETNLRYGCHILQYYLQREKGHLAKALARYNGSVGKTWYSERVLVAWEKRWSGGRL